MLHLEIVALDAFGDGKFKYISDVQSAPKTATGIKKVLSKALRDGDLLGLLCADLGTFVNATFSLVDETGKTVAEYTHKFSFFNTNYIFNSFCYAETQKNWKLKTYKIA